MLRLLTEQHQVSVVRVDAGGGLNGALLRAGLAHEISVIIAPYLATSATAEPLHLIADLGSLAMALELTALERLLQGHVWLRYTVHDSPFPG